MFLSFNVKTLMTIQRLGCSPPRSTNAHCEPSSKTICILGLRWAHSWMPAPLIFSQVKPSYAVRDGSSGNTGYVSVCFPLRQATAIAINKNDTMCWIFILIKSDFRYIGSEVRGFSYKLYHKRSCSDRESMVSKNYRAIRRVFSA